MTSDKSREARLRRLALKEHKFFHKARRPFLEGCVKAKYYISDMNNNLVSWYADLDAAEEDLHQ